MVWGEGVKFIITQLSIRQFNKSLCYKYSVNVCVYGGGAERRTAPPQPPATLPISATCLELYWIWPYPVYLKRIKDIALKMRFFKKIAIGPHTLHRALRIQTNDTKIKQTNYLIVNNMLHTWRGLCIIFTKILVTFILT